MRHAPARFRPSTLAILRAAAGDGTGIWELPGGAACVPIENAAPLAALALQLGGSLLAGIPRAVLPEVGLIIGTTLGCLETDRAFDRSRRENPRYASPAAFAKTLPSTVAAEMAVAFSLTGPSLTVLAGAHSTALALRRAAAWMRHFELRYCIAGGMDLVGENPSSPARRQVGLVLLAAAGSGIGSMTVREYTTMNPAAIRDTSLDQLLAWIQSGGKIDLGAGVRLDRPRGADSCTTFMGEA